MVARVAHGFGELLDRDRRRRDVGIPEREVDDVFAGPAELHLQRVDLGERVRRQRVDAAELRVLKSTTSTVPGVERRFSASFAAATLARCLLRKPCCSTSAGSSISPITTASSPRSRAPSSTSTIDVLDRAHYAGAAQFPVVDDVELDWPRAGDALPRRVHHRVRMSPRPDAPRRSAHAPRQRVRGRRPRGRGSSRVRSTGCARSSRPACTSASSRTPTAPSHNGSPRQKSCRSGPGSASRSSASSTPARSASSKPDPRIFQHRARRDRRRRRRRVVRRRHAGNRRRRRRGAAGLWPIVMDPFDFQAGVDYHRVTTLAEVAELVSAS